MKPTWTFAKIWNTSLENQEERVLKPRNNIWAGELGGAMVDRYLKMKAVPFTNPPNPRSKRKFEAGNIWEAIIGFVLTRAGIIQSKQNWLSYQYPNLLQVTGKLDFVAGGTPDYDKANTVIQKDLGWLPPFISRATQAIVSKLKEQFPDGLKDIILEIKSCSSFMYEIYERNKTASPQHKLQLFHYLKALGLDEGHIVYISKDDARLLEFGIFNPSTLEQAYENDIKQMTQYFSSNIEPPKENFIIFDPEFRKFSANWRVGYSNYLTYLYGLANQFMFDSKYKPIVAKWNRVLERIKENKKMTDQNKEALNEIRRAGFDVDVIKSAIADTL